MLVYRIKLWFKTETQQLSSQQGAACALLQCMYKMSVNQEKSRFIKDREASVGCKERDSEQVLLLLVLQASKEATMMQVGVKLTTTNHE